MRDARRVEDAASQTHAELTVPRLTVDPQLAGVGTLNLRDGTPTRKHDPGAGVQWVIEDQRHAHAAPQRLNLGNLTGLWGPAILKGESAFTRTTAGLDHGASTATVTIAPGTFAGQSLPLRTEVKVNGGFAALTATLTASLDDYQRGSEHINNIAATAQIKRTAQEWQGSLRADAKLGDAPF